MNHTKHVLVFICQSRWTDLPEPVRHQSKRCLLDALGALIAGHHTPVGKMMQTVALDQFPGDQASILVSGKRASAAGVALANGFAGNALDIDDGYRKIKGHPGATVLPVILAAAQLAAFKAPVSGKRFLTALAVGYEVSIRAGLIRHAVSDTYHSSGSWGAIGGCAAGGRLLGLSEETLKHALGAAEYHAPIAPMMKCIVTPSMGKDSIGWGCLVAMMSLCMARAGFTGIRPLFDDTPDHSWIASLGNAWEILSVYFKPYSACRWAQPGVDGALKLLEAHDIRPSDIRSIDVFTFRESAALSRDYPENTEEAQYNIAFPIAAAILDGEVGPAQTLPPRLHDKDIRKLMDKIRITAEERFQTRFPDRAESEINITTRDGRVFSSGEMSARWDPHSTFPTDDELTEKFLWLVKPVLGLQKAERLKEIIWDLDRYVRLDDFYKSSVV